MLFEIKDLRVNYEGAEVLKGLSMGVEEGEIVTLIGNNGAGKTTTLRTISGLKRPASGEIWYQGKRSDRMSPKNVVRAGIIHVPQGKELFPYMSVSENLRLGAFLRRNKNKIKKDLENLLEYFPVLKGRSRQQAGTLSGGEQQMLAIACALMGNPTLLLLDEPSIGLAPIVVREIGKIAVEINKRGTSILLVEQNARMALSIAHRGYVLETGKLVLQGKCKELLADARVKNAYLGH